MGIEIRVRKSPKRILFDISEHWHQEVKAHAAFKHMSIRQWVMHAIIKQIAEENKVK